VAESSQNEIDTHLAAGDRRFDDRDYAGAVDAYSLALLLDTGLAYAYCNRGSAKRRLGDYDGAVRDLTRAIHIRSDYALAHNNRGFARLKNGHLDGAVEDFSRAIALGDDGFPSYSVGMTYKNRAKAYRALGRTAEAEADEDTARNWRRRAKVR
jgi:tetratricopeptide (TPR) repeat protein